MTFKVIFCFLTLLYGVSTSVRCGRGQSIPARNFVGLAAALTGLFWAFGVFD